MPKKESKTIAPRNVIDRNLGPWKIRLMIGTPSTGSVRMEWVMARYGQVIPTNWSATDCIQWISSYAPMQYLVPDAQNLIVQAAIDSGAEWLLLIESDNCPPADAFLRLNEYMREKKFPVISGLYFTKSEPPEPMTYRGRGNSYFHKWKMGERVMCDGVPTGFLLIHMSILRAMWEESEEYALNGKVTRRVFTTPERVWTDPESGGTYALTGTSDLVWCERVMRGKFFEKAGWPKFAKMEFPFLVDTNIFVKHIAEDGRQYPLRHPTEFGF